jgi:RNA polymerase sigma-70 factor (ECF subfamily)
MPIDRRSFPVWLAPGTLDQGDDTELVEALKAGQADAPAVAWNRYAPLVFGICSRALGSEIEAEDLTQDVFSRLFARIGTLRKPSAFRSFITSFAIRTVKWELRRRRARRFLTLSATGDLPEAPRGFVSADNRYALQRFYQVLDKLSTRERLVLVLRHVEEMTLDEIADSMGISLATVKRTIRRANERASALVGDDAELQTFLSGRGEEA